MPPEKAYSLSETTTAPAPAAAAVARGSLRDYVELTKPRLSLMSVLSAVIGYLAAMPGRDLLEFGVLFAGTALSAGGAAVLNQWMEREADAKMRRTAKRPLPAGSVSAPVAFIYGLALSAAGPLLLLAGTNALSALLAVATLAIYLLIYTPLKRVSPWTTEIGAIPGALPPLIGWTAANGGYHFTGWFLFAVLFAWQVPHFMAISWMYRDDYRRGGFRMLSIDDPSGDAPAQRALVWSTALLVITVLPWLVGVVGMFYLIPGVLLSGWMLVASIRFAKAPKKDQAARKLFFASIFYLPVFLFTFVFDRYVF